MNTTKLKKYAYLDVVIHQLHQRPKLFTIPKLLLNTFLYVIPFLFLISVTILIIIAVYFQEIKIHRIQQESLSLQSIKKENLQLENQIINSKVENTVLQQKLLTPSTESLGITPGIFSPVPGQKDLSGQGKSQIDNMTIKRFPNSLEFHFHIKNLTNGKERLSGYIFGIAKAKNALYIYPENALPVDRLSIPFNKGDSFGTYRFRPSVVKFPIANNVPVELFEIFIFSRTGDLLAKKVFSPTKQESI